MQDNPYSSIINLWRKDGGERAVSPWRLGRVVSRSPVAVRIGKETLSGAELLVNPRLLRSEREDDLIYPNDRVVLLQSGDGQQFVVLCKVVSGS